MGKIAKKKKGRPSKADLARRSGIGRNLSQEEQEDTDLRRSLRRRNPIYRDEYEDEEDEDERRREKKLKLVLKLPHKAGFSGVESSPNLSRAEVNVGHASAPDSRAVALSGSSSEYGDSNKPFKKRKIDGDEGVYDDGGEGDEVRSDEDDDDDDTRSMGSGNPKKETGRNADSKGMDSVPGTPSGSLLGVPLPDKRSLELILDKLQKKDTYGVYAEPVDPEELPDYHEVIEHPMDFSTVRKKLAAGAYSKLEQFESDIFLICSNAMQYNAPETIYFKQARSIQELARKKFQRLRMENEGVVTELKPEQNPKSTSTLKKLIKNSLCRTAQEPVGSDFSSGATLATAGDTCTWSNTMQAGACEKPSSGDGLVDGNSSLTDNKIEKAEEQPSGRGLLPKFGRKPFVLDENRRATYNISSQPMVTTDSIFTTFDGENKQLVSVGLNADHFYARSLARFAATLGPTAWKVASRRIEKALPAGLKFGRGWVGEYEPLPTPVVMLENRMQKQPSNATNLQCEVDLRKDAKTAEKPLQHDTKKELRNLNSIPMSTSNKTPIPVKELPVSRIPIEGNPGLFGVSGTKPTVTTMYQLQNPLTMNFPKPENNLPKQVQLNLSSSTNGNPIDITSQKQLEHRSEMTTSRLMEMVSRNKNLVHPVPFKQPETDGVIPERLPNGKTNSNSDGNKANSSFPNFVPNQQGIPMAYFPRGNQEHGLTDPVQLMKMMAERGQNQQKSSNNPQVMPSVPSSRRDDSSTAASAAARAWMSIGAARLKQTEISSSPKMQIDATSLYNPARELPPSVSRFHGELPVSGGLRLQSENRFNPQAFFSQPGSVGEEAWRQNNRPMGFPQLVTPDLSRLQMQSQWRGLSPCTQPTPKQDMRPPDLNIGFQPSGSPVRQSSGILVDSQQPDLALQL